jgi:osmotically-inducible protein OsmY
MILVRRTRLAAPTTRPRFALGRRRARAAPPRASAWSTATAAAGGVALGAFIAYFSDPRVGRRRRHTVRDRALSRVRRGERRAMVRARRAESHAVGIARRTVNARRFRRGEPVDDVTLTHKVESELSRLADVPKGQIVINAEDGVVFLRGVIEREDDIERLEAATRKIAGVRAVENLLHLPGTPAPAGRSKLERQRASD